MKIKISLMIHMQKVFRQNLVFPDERPKRMEAMWEVWPQH